MIKNIIYISFVVIFCMTLEIKGVSFFLTLILAGILGLLGFYLKIIKIDNI